MKNTHSSKKIVPKAIVFLMIMLTISILAAPMSPVSAQDGEATLTGTIYDLGVDTDDDGIYETLDIGVEVNVTVAGTFKVEVTGLRDFESEAIQVSDQNSTQLDTGVQIVYVSLDGPTIYESWLSPFNVSTIKLYDASGSSLDSISDVALTKSYHFSQFGLLPATLTGTITDVGMDLNSNDLYDVLRVGVEVNVTTAGTFTLDLGGLYDASYNVLSGAALNSTYLAAGVHFIYVDINGAEIYAATVSPTTLATILLYDNSNRTLGKINDITLPTTYTFDEFERPNVEIVFLDVERKVMLDQAGSIYVTNTYLIENVGFWITSVEVGFPEDAYDFAVRDHMGKLTTSTGDNLMTVTLRDTVYTNETLTLYVSYHLPWNNHVSKTDGVDYILQSTFYEEFNSTLKKLTVEIVLPKGAKFESSAPREPVSVEEVSLRDTLSFSFSDVTPSDDLSFQIGYKYDIFWGSFYPTVWMGLLAFVASALVFVWGGPKTISAPTITVASKDLNSFIDSYEEKESIRAELESLDERLQKGKIPRRRYKVRKKMLDSRLATVSRNLSSLSAKIRCAGSKYSSMMRQIEVAEANLESAERDQQRVEAKYRRGEVSKGAYGKLMEEYKSKIEDAQATIDGVLLRLRE